MPWWSRPWLWWFALVLTIIRYRLYEIDRLVSRTVTYALVALVVGAVFAVPVILIPNAIGGSSDLVVAGATLAAAAVFSPVRRVIQDRVDRRFNRSRYNAAHEIEELATPLNASPSTGASLEGTISLSSRVLEPESIGLWVR